MHVRAGRVYAIGMTLIFLTAVPLAILGRQRVPAADCLFQFLPGLRPVGVSPATAAVAPNPIDWCAVAIMGLTGLGMWGYAVVLGTVRRPGIGSPCWCLEAIAVALSAADGLFFNQGREHRNRRPAASPSASSDTSPT